ncbi:hypothetical protein AX14_008586, partial [Amanita brunnescens Koide BX004]
MVRLVLTIFLALALLSQTSVGLPIGRLSKRVDPGTVGAAIGVLCGLCGGACLLCRSGACVCSDHDHAVPLPAGHVELQPISHAPMNAARPQG